MENQDFSVESEEEFYEDFVDSKLSDEEVEEILHLARQTSNIKLRRLAKEVQLWRLFTPQLLELAEKNSEENNILIMARLFIKGESNFK